MYAIKDNADLKAFSLLAHVNPGLENCINKLITHYFLHLFNPLCDAENAQREGDAGMEGRRESRCVAGQSRERWICRGFHCPIVCTHLLACVHACMHQHPYLMSTSLCVP